MLIYVRQFLKIRIVFHTLGLFIFFFPFLTQVTHYLTAVKIFKKSIDWKISVRTSLRCCSLTPYTAPKAVTGPLHDTFTWYGINYVESQVIQWDSQRIGTRTRSARLTFVLKVPLCELRPSIIYSVPYCPIVQRAY